MRKIESEEKEELNKKKKSQKKIIKKKKSHPAEEVFFVHKDLPAEGVGGSEKPGSLQSEGEDTNQDDVQSTQEMSKQTEVSLDITPLSTSHVLVDPKESQKRMEKQLEALYKNEDGDMPNLNTFEKRKRSSFLRALGIFFFTAFLLLVVASAGLFYFRPNSAFEEKNVVVSTVGKEEVVVGEVSTYTINYQNNNKTALSDAVLRVRYPDGFVFISSDRDPRNESKDEWSLGTLAPGEKGSIEVSGNFYANLGSEQSFRLFLDYLPANFSSSFQAVAVTTVRVTQSPYEITLEVPPEVVAGSKTLLRIRVVPPVISDFTSSTVFLRLNSGSFMVQESRPKADEGSSVRWTLPVGTQPFELDLTGSFSLAEDGTSAPVSAQLVMLSPTTSNQEVVVAETSGDTKIVTSEVVLDRVINGSTGDLSVQPGDTLSASLVLRNTDGSDLQNVQLRAIFLAPAFNDRSILAWDKLGDELDGVIVGEKVSAILRRGIITWDGGKYSALKKIEPGKEVNIDFSLPIRSGADLELGNFTTSTAEFVVEARYTLGGETKVVTSLPIKITLNSDLRFETRHQEERVGDKATHEVTWILQNSFHDLKEITVGADVYGDVALAKEAMVVPAGEVNYDEEKKKIVWKIDQMPTSIDVLPFRFVIEQKSINPSQTELISKVEIRATDVETGRQIILVDSAVKLAE